MKNIFINTDGGSRGNPGPSGIGVVIKTESSEILGKIFRRIGVTTNNVAEYQAVIYALEWLRNNLTMKQFNNGTMFNFFLDSTLVVNQLNGLFKVKNSDLRNLLVKIRQLEQEVGGNVKYQYIPREKNWEADLLVNQALDNS